MSTRYIAGVIVASIGLAALVGAQTSNDAQLARCSSIEPDSLRLSCYDSISTALRRADTSASSVGGTLDSLKAVLDSIVGRRPGAGAWMVHESTNPLDDSQIVTVILDSESGRTQFGAAISLVARCKSRKTELYINWSDYLGLEGTLVTTRIGNGDADRKRWSISTDKTSTFAPGDPERLLREISKVTKFVAQVTPYNESPITAVFNVTGLAEALKPLRAACEW